MQMKKKWQLDQQVYIFVPEKETLGKRESNLILRVSIIQDYSGNLFIARYLTFDGRHNLADSRHSVSHHRRHRQCQKHVCSLAA